MVGGHHMLLNTHLYYFTFIIHIPSSLFSILFSSLLCIAMLARFKSPFNMEGGHHVHENAKNTKSSTTTYASSRKGIMVVGLQSLIQISEGKSNVVIKSALKAAPPLPATSATEYYCYLKSCYLCNKKLSLDKDIYMYRGDQGFCSIDCRDRQIVLDEMREIEESTKQMLKSYRKCSAADRNETRQVLEELHRRHKPIAHQKHPAIVS